MVGIQLKVPYLPQIQRSDPERAGELRALVQGLARDYDIPYAAGAEGGLFLLRRGEPCARLRVAETARRLQAGLEAFDEPIGGAWILVESGGEDLEALKAELRRLWLSSSRRGLVFGPRAAALFAGYVELEDGDAEGGRVVTSFPYARGAEEGPGPGNGSRRTDLEEARIAEATRLLIAAAASVAESGAEPAACILAKGPVEEAAPFAEHCIEAAFGPGRIGLRLAPSRGPSPFAAVLDALDRSPGAPGESVRPRKPEESAAYVRASPLRRSFPPELAADFRAKALEAALERLSSSRPKGPPALLVVEEPDRLAEDSGTFLRELLLALSGGAIGPVLVLLVGEAWPGGLGELGSRRAVIAAAGLDGRENGRREGPPTLGSLPPEFALALQALALSEGVLAEEARREFFAKAGFGQALLGLVFGRLARLGAVESRGAGLWPRPLAGAEVAEGEAGAEGGGLLDLFRNQLLGLHRAGRIKTSFAFLDTVAPRLAEPRAVELMALESLPDELVYGSSTRGAGVAAAESCRAFADFLRAQAGGPREEAEAAAAAKAVESRAAQGPRSELATAAAGLAKAQELYARGRPQEASAAARAALMALHAQGAARTEARAQRLLGLCSLATGQVQDGLGYLANARDMGARQGDPLECFHASLAEGGAYLAEGDLKRALAAREAAERHARSAFRPAWTAAALFLGGRLGFELGAYGRAEEGFAAAAAAAKGEPGLERRCALWGARAAAAGAVVAGREAPPRALEALDREDGDPESAWFRAELRARAGDWREAARLCLEALRGLGRELPAEGSEPSRLQPALSVPVYRTLQRGATGSEGGYAPPDHLSWGSGFEAFEGRCVGFSGRPGLLEDLVAGFAEYCLGMAGEPSAWADSLIRRCREGRISSSHPAAHLYLFRAYLVLGRIEAERSDRGTLLSKCFKALQVRAAKLDEAGLKEGFLERNLENRAIMAEARANKLL